MNSKEDPINQTFNSGGNEISISLNNVKVTKSGDSYIVKTQDGVIDLGKITIIPQHKADIDNLASKDIELASNHSISINPDDNSVFSKSVQLKPKEYLDILTNSSEQTGGNILKKKSKRKTKKGKPSRLRVKNLNKHKKNTQKVPF